MQQHIILHRKLPEEATKKIWQNCLKIKQEKSSQDTLIIRWLLGAINYFSRSNKLVSGSEKQDYLKYLNPDLQKKNSKSFRNSIVEKIAIMDVISSLQRNTFKT